MNSKSLISFVQDEYASVLSQNGLSVEEALKDEGLRPLLEEAYKKHVEEMRVQQIKKGVGAMTELLKGHLGITPADEAKVTVSDWATSFVRGKTSELPAPNLNGAGDHLCGLPSSVPCCDKQHKVGKYAVYEGAIYGICKNVVGAYSVLWGENQGQTSRLLMSSPDIEKLNRVVAQQEELKPLRDWLTQLEYGKGEFPASNLNQDEEHCCGLPESIPCCDKQSAVSRFACYKGVVYGICQTAGEEYHERVKQAGKNPSGAFKTTSKKELVESIAKTQRRNTDILNYVQQMGSGLLADKRLPVESQDEDGKYRCGLPQDVPCCDKQKTVELFASHDGELYGICGTAGAAYINEMRRYDRASAPKALKFTKDFELAQRIASNNTASGGNGNGHQYPAAPTKSKEPVGLQTPPLSDEEREKRLEAKKELRADLKDRLLKAGVPEVDKFVRSIEKKMRRGKGISDPCKAISEYAVCRVLADSSRRDSSLLLAAAVDLSSEEFDQLVEARKVAEVEKSKEASKKAANKTVNIPMAGKIRVGGKGKSNGKGEEKNQM